MVRRHPTRLTRRRRASHERPIRRGARPWAARCMTWASRRRRGRTAWASRSSTSGSSTAIACAWTTTCAGAVDNCAVRITVHGPGCPHPPPHRLNLLSPARAGLYRRAEPALVWSAALIRPQGQPRADCAALEQPITRNLPHLCPSRRRLAALNGPSGEYSGRSRVRLERRATDRTLSRARRAQVCILLLGGSRPRTQDTTYERAATAARRRRFFLRRPCCSAGRAMPALRIA